MHSSAGGSGGSGEMRYDPAAMNSAAIALRSSTVSLDSGAGAAPTGGDYGAAAPLVAAIIAAVSDAGASIAGEASLLAGSIHQTSGFVQATDQLQSLDLLRTGRTP